MKFIDVYNGDEITNFDEVKNNFCGVIAKASEGTTGQDSYCRYRYEQCSARDIPIGFYHMLCITSEPETQAENFYNMVGKFKNTIKNCLDVEYDNLKSRAEEYANRFLKRYFELSGQDMIIYSCESYFKDNFSENFLNSHDLWVACYGRKPKGLPNVVAWQYSDTCKDYNFVGNDEGCVDINELFVPDRFFREGCTVSAPAINTNSVQENIYLTLQRELNRQGFKDKNGNVLAEDGVPGELTLSACPIIKYGCEGEISRWVQLRIMSPEEADGKFYNKSVQALKWMQANKWGIDPDGICGVLSWSHLLALA